MHKVKRTDIFEEARPHDRVSFSIICRPQSSVTLEDFHSRLSVKTIAQFLPTRDTQTRIEDQLRSRGFEIFRDSGPFVCGRGTIKHFQDYFGIQIRRRVRRVTIRGVEQTYVSFVRAPGSEHILPPAELDALWVAIAQPPLHVTPEIPPAPTTNGLELHLPGDVAQLTEASATHRHETPSGHRATGAGVWAAVIDTGFAHHPYYKDNGYHITRLVASDAADADYDFPMPHGTAILANLFACAPDVHAYAIKHGDNIALAIVLALLLIPMPAILSCSWVYPLDNDEPSLPNDLLPVKVAILFARFLGVTVVVSAGNDADDDVTFPAMMPEVIAVGGVTVGGDDGLSKWPDSSSFVSPIYPDRAVPDLCGIATEMLLPVPAKVTGTPYSWDGRAGGTSAGAPQIAGVCALLLQKDPSLTHDKIRAVLCAKAKAVGPETGAGLVRALHAWKAV
jgi:hypothetical protein